MALFYLYSMFTVEKDQFSLILTELATFSGEKWLLKAQQYDWYIFLPFPLNFKPSKLSLKGNVDHDPNHNKLTLHTSRDTVRAGEFGQGGEFRHPLC